MEVPEPPQSLAIVGGVHYYRYSPTAGFRVWARDRTLARWSSVERRIAHDGSARPMWFALRTSLARGGVDVLQPQLAATTRFGLSIEVRAPARGPRSAPAVSEALVDGGLCALHAGAPSALAADIAGALATKLPGVDRDLLAELVSERAAVLAGSAFKLSPAGVQLSPSDEFCDAGQVTIIRDPSASVIQTSGDVFTLRHVDDA